MTSYPESRSRSWIWDSFPEPRTIPMGWDLSSQDDPGDAETHQFGFSSWEADLFESES